jgi:GTPase SAR1 family protein
MKILLVGPNKVGKSAMLAKLRKEPAGGEEQSLVAVESFQIEGQQVTVFEVSEMSLIGNQANGADGIMLLVDPKDKAKLYGGVEILGAISSEPQLDRVPVAILIRTSEGASMLREVQSMMDLHRLRDREIVFK